MLQVNFDWLTVLINWISWCKLKWKKKCNYRSDLIYHSKYRLLSFEFTRKTCEGLTFKQTCVICDEEGRGYVSNIKTQLDCKYLCADQFEPLTFSLLPTPSPLAPPHLLLPPPPPSPLPIPSLPYPLPPPHSPFPLPPKIKKQDKTIHSIISFCHVDFS